MSALGLVLGAAALAAQAGTGEAVTSQPASHQSEAPVTPQVSDVPGRTANVVSDGAMDLNINEKKSELVLSYSWAARAQQVQRDGITASVVQDAVTAELTLPLGGADNLLSRGTFDGLDDGPSFSLSWTSFGTRTGDLWETSRNPRLARLTREAVQNCLAEVRAGTATEEGFTAERCRLFAPSPDVLRPERDFLRRFSGLSIPELNRLLLSQVSGFGLEASIGLNRFNYRTPVTLVENSDAEPQFSIKAYGILFPRDGVSMLTGSVSYGNSYEAQNSQILCRAVVALPNDDCVSAPPGPPEHVETVQLELEYRRMFQPIPGLGQFAIAPRVAVDVLSDEYEIELPIYFAPSGTNRILPGVTISYDSRHDEVVFGLFLRRTFSFGG